MKDDRTLERAARSFIEVGPTRAPEHAVDAALLRIQTTSQERDLRIPWRFPTMPLPARLVALAVVGALVLAGLALLGGAGRPALTTTAPSPSSTPAPVQVIPDGRYVGAVIEVADILDQITRDTSFNAAEKDAIIDTILGIRGASTYQTRIDVLGSSMRVDQSVDGQSHPESWSLAPSGDDRIAATWSSGTIEFEVRGCGLPGSTCGYTFQAMTPAPSDVEAFVRRLIFETSGPFMPVSPTPSASAPSPS